MKLATYEIDSYELDDGEAVHKEYSDTFWIPEKEKRESLQSGDLVKLIFRMEERNNKDNVSVERMWVEVTGISGQFYTGILDNDPSGDVSVACGQKVYFNSCHVIDIYEENT